MACGAASQASVPTLQGQHQTPHSEGPILLLPLGSLQPPATSDTHPHLAPLPDQHSLRAGCTVLPFQRLSSAPRQRLPTLVQGDKRQNPPEWTACPTCCPSNYPSRTSRPSCRAHCTCAHFLAHFSNRTLSNHVGVGLGVGPTARRAAAPPHSEPQGPGPCGRHFADRIPAQV